MSTGASSHVAFFASNCDGLQCQARPGLVGSLAVVLPDCVPEGPSA